MTARGSQAAAFCRALTQYGERVEHDGAAYRAFLQPVRRVENHGGQSQLTPLGAVDETTFLYLGDPALPLHEGEELVWQGRILVVTQSYPVQVSGEPVYQWASLRVAL